MQNNRGSPKFFGRPCLSKKESLIYIRRVQSTITFHIIVIFWHTIYTFLMGKTFPTMIKENDLLHSEYSFSVTMVT